MLAVIKNGYGNVIDLETHLSDGRLTEPSNGNRFEWRKMIEEVKKKGRPLTEEEAENFRVKDYENLRNF